MGDLARSLRLVDSTSNAVRTNERWRGIDELDAAAHIAQCFTHAATAECAVPLLFCRKQFSIVPLGITGASSEVKGGALSFFHVARFADDVICRLDSESV
jgi:hypothetical protein